MMSEAADARLVHLNESVVFPLLQRNADNMLIAMCHQLKATGMADVGKLAYISACRDLMQELEAIANKGDRAVGRLENYRNK